MVEQQLRIMCSQHLNAILTFAGSTAEMLSLTLSSFICPMHCWMSTQTLSPVRASWGAQPLQGTHACSASVDISAQQRPTGAHGQTCRCA